MRVCITPLTPEEKFYSAALLRNFRISFMIKRTDMKTTVSQRSIKNILNIELPLADAMASPNPKKRSKELDGYR